MSSHRKMFSAFKGNEATAHQYERLRDPNQCFSLESYSAELLQPRGCTLGIGYADYHRLKGASDIPFMRLLNDSLPISVQDRSAAIFF